MMTYYEVTEKHIDEIMDNFDFAKVHKVMKFLNWGWCTSVTYDHVNTYVPDESRLRKKARELLRLVARERDATIATGGFEVRNITGNDVDDKWVKLSLVFNLESWELDGETYE